MKAFKAKEKSSWAIPSGRSHLPERSFTRAFLYKASHFKLGFTNVVVTRAGPLQEWLLGELKLQMFGCSREGLTGGES